MLKLALPTGSLQKPTLDMFAAAELSITTPNSRCYEAFIEDPRVSCVRWLRPQEIPVYVADGLFDLGIAGYDWVLERGCKDRVQIVTKLPYSRGSNRPVRIVVAVSEDADEIKTAADIKPGSKVTTEYVEITKEYFAKLGIPVKVEFSFGTTEAKVPEIADVAVELTESGSSLRANRLKIVDTIVESSTVLIANPETWENEDKRQCVNDLVTLLLGALDARGRVLRKMNVAKANLDKVLQVLPAMKAPTVSQLVGGETEYLAVETVVDKNGINLLIPQLKKAGAEDIIELPISKIIK